MAQPDTSRMDRIENAMEALVRSQSQLLHSQVILTGQVDELRQSQKQTDDALRHFIEESEKAKLVLDAKMAGLSEKMAESSEKLNALIDIVDNMIRGKL